MITFCQKLAKLDDYIAVILAVQHSGMPIGLLNHAAIVGWRKFS